MKVHLERYVWIPKHECMHKHRQQTIRRFSETTYCLYILDYSILIKVTKFFPFYRVYTHDNNLRVCMCMYVYC